MTIRETCGCGAVLQFASSRNVAALDIAKAQKSFHQAHKKCKPKEQDKS